MHVKARIMDEITMRRCLTRITHEIIEHNDGVQDVVLMGVRRKGVPIAHILHDNLLSFEGVDVPIGELDVTKHRDDLSEDEKLRHLKDSYFPCSIIGKNVIIVDDVFYTGRTAKAALDALMEYGRPKSVQMAVLVDRGHRELPIRSDYVGKNVPTSKEETIRVILSDLTEENGVFILGGK